MDYLAAILPSVGVLALFVLAIRAIFQADQRERLAQAKLERSESIGPGPGVTDSGDNAGPGGDAG